MTIPLIQTKLFAPLVPPELVSRPRLIELFEAGIHRKLTLVSAPAGFGKTTLLAEWYHQHHERSQDRRAVVWVSLDKDDDEPSHYWTYFIAALQTIHPELGHSEMAMIQIPQPPPIETCLTSLINEITKRADPFVIILDDYHMIENKAIHRAMTFLLEHMPAQMHMVIASRVDPPLPLALLRGRNQLNELRAADLRFTYDEAEDFFNRVMKLGLSKSGVKALENRTEGWVASLQMAAISMRGHNDIQEFINSFSGSQRYVLDYLTEEVFTQQAPDVQSFLLQTSILDRLTAPLCNAVTKRTDAKEKLDYLEAANLFLVPLDDDRKWFRYHSLFADLLRNQLNRSSPDLPSTLHQRASQWFEQEELAAEAIDHAFAAEDLERVANLIEKIAVPMITIESKVSTLLRWLARLPDEFITTRPWLCIALASARIADGRWDDIEPLLRSAESVLKATEKDGREPAERIKISSAVRALRASANTLGGINIQVSLDLLRESYEQLPNDETFTRSPIALNLGVAHATKGEMSTASRFLNESITLAQTTGNPYVALLGLSCLAEIQIKMGLLHQAAETDRRALRLGAEWSDSSEPLSATGYAHISLAEILYQWNELDEALEHLTLGIKLSEQCGAALFVQFFYPGIALMEKFQDKATSMPELRDLVKRIGHGSYTALLSRLLDAWQARLSLAHGDIKATQRWAASHEIELNIHNLPDLGQEFSYLTLARLHIARNKAEEIHDLLEKMRRKAESEERIGSVIEILVLQSIALENQGKIDQAIGVLKEALLLAEPEGYVRIFVDEGEPMKQLLGIAASRGIASAYITKLLESFSGSIHALEDQSLKTTDNNLTTLRYTTSTPKLVDPLSTRELEIIRLMATGATSKEIASALTVSNATVKKHIIHIYRKLDVHKQTMAVSKAQELGLL